MRLREGWRVLWRAEDALQIGVDSPGSLILEGLRAPERDFLLALGDGPLPPPDLPGAHAVLGLLRRMGILDGPGTAGAHGSWEPARWSALERLTDSPGPLEAEVPALGRLGVDPATILRRRGTMEVCIDGSGDLAARIAEGLAAAGIGRLTLRHDDAQDPGPATAMWDSPSPAALAAHLRTAYHGLEITVSGPSWSAEQHADVTVIVRPWHIDPPTAGDLLAHDGPHLAVVSGDVEVEVGPLVLPGTTACLRCVALARTALDPAWPAVATQLMIGPPPRTPVSTQQRAAGLAVQAALAFLDGRPGGLVDLAPEGASEGPAHAPESWSVRVSTADLTQRTSRWALEPTCGCARVP